MRPQVAACYLIGARGAMRRPAVSRSFDGRTRVRALWRGMSESRPTSAAIPPPGSPWPGAAPGTTARSFSLAAIGAALGLLLAGRALFTAPGTSTLAVPAEDVALVNQQPIARIDYLAQIRALYGVDYAQATAAQRHQVLDDMIREELFVQRAREIDVAAGDPDVRAAMVTAVEMQIAADALTTQPSEAQLRDYFTAHRDRYSAEGTLRVRDLRFAPGDAARAQAAAAALRNAPPAAAPGGGFGAVEPPGSGAEEFYFAARLHLGANLFALARGLHAGEVSAPVALADGIHVLYVQENRTPQPIDFAAARPQVLADLRAVAVARLKAQSEGYLRKRATVRIAADLQ